MAKPETRPNPPQSLWHVFNEETGTVTHHGYIDRVFAFDEARILSKESPHRVIEYVLKDKRGSDGET